jgi:phage terminase large subunit-like protein
VFPKGKHDDLVDSVTEARLHLRNHGIAQTGEVVVAEKNERVTHRPRPRKAPYST